MALGVAGLAILAPQVAGHQERGVRPAVGSGTGRRRGLLVAFVPARTRLAYDRNPLSSLVNGGEQPGGPS